MNVLFIASEMEPYAKSGGLADVIASLPKELIKNNVKVKVVIPLYSSINYTKYKIRKLFPSSCVHMGTCEEWYGVHHTKEPYGIDVYFIEFNKYFNRPGYYHDSTGEYKDNGYRFSFFSRAALQLARDLDFCPDIVHAHDWQTALANYYVKLNLDSFFQNTKTVLTIHNMGYQGILNPSFIDYAMIKYNDYNSGYFESFGAVNLLKGGIVCSDKLTTVSETYAQEILKPIGSNGLDTYLLRKAENLKGILNGVDTQIWDPKNDKYLKNNYDLKSYKTGKKNNKSILQKMFNLEQNSKIPLLSFIGRFAEQKGGKLLMHCLDSVIKQMVCQIIVLGSGDSELENFFGNAPKHYPGRVGSYIGYNEELAHLIEAGSDFFIMPSLYEPCGLNQMYSQIYGTLPIVRATGGLVDTVDQYDEATGEGSGFRFTDITPQALNNTIGWAVSTYYDRPEHIDKMINNAMKKDFSWGLSARKYLELYKSIE